MSVVIEARDVSKRFGKVQALDGLSLNVETGEMVAVLGPNGAGKTTFVRILATLVRPSRGTVLVGGHDVRTAAARVRSFIGLAGQQAALEVAMTGRENLELVARLYGLPRRQARHRAGEVIEALDLGEIADRLVRTYSGGERRRFDLASSLAGAPRLLLLDEPTTGLDPRSRIELWDAIRDLAGRGTDVLLTTQYLDEADQLAGRIVIIDHGRVIADGSPSELKARAGRDVIEVHTPSVADLPSAARALSRIGPDSPVIDPATRRVSVPVDGGTQQLTAAARALEGAAVVVDDISLRRPTLDEVFLALTGRPTDESDGALASRERTSA